MAKVGFQEAYGFSIRLSNWCIIVLGKQCTSTSIYNVAGWHEN